MKKPKPELLALMADGEFHSGETIARQLSVSRAAVWKMIRQLQQLGIPVEAVRGKGYRVLKPMELLSADRIRDQLSPDHRPRSLDVLLTTDSTNAYLSARSATDSIHAHVVLSEHQSAGKGRRGNMWVSPFAGGFYLSVGWQFDLLTENTGHLSLYTAVAVVRSLKAVGLKPVTLKWPNDILLDGQKIGGVLIDMRGEINGPVSVIIGIGINYDLTGADPLLVDQAVTDICRHAEAPVSRNDFAATLIGQVFALLLRIGKEETQGLLQEWRDHDGFKGKRARLHFQDKVIEGTVKGVDDLGALLMNVNGQTQRYTSGELSLRPVQ